MAIKVKTQYLSSFHIPPHCVACGDTPGSGTKDELIPLEAEQSLVDALEACGGDVQITIFPDVGHELNSEKIYTPELYEWLLEQSLK